MNTVLEIPLSDTTHVFVSRRSKNKNIPYAGIKRTSPNDANYKRFFYFTLANILTLLDYLPKLKALSQIKGERPRITMELDKYKNVGISSYYGKKYLSFDKKSTAQGPFFNLKMEELDQLIECAQQIRQAVNQLVEPSPTTPTEQDCGYIPRGLTMYKFLYTCPTTGKLHKEADRWYLNQVECRREGVAYDSCLDLQTPPVSDYFSRYGAVRSVQKRPEMFIFDSLFTIPDNATLTKKAFIFAIKHIVGIIRDKDCGACDSNIPYTSEAHDLGCCLPWEDCVQAYYQEQILDQTDVQAMVLRLVRTINDNLPDQERQGLLKERLEKKYWPSVQDIIDFTQTLGDELEQVFIAAENLSNPEIDQID